MSRPCSVCLHARRDEAEKLLRQGISIRRSATEIGVGTAALHRHWRWHAANRDSTAARDPLPRQQSQGGTARDGTPHGALGVFFDSETSRRRPFVLLVREMLGATPALCRCRVSLSSAPTRRRARAGEPFGNPEEDRIQDIRGKHDTNRHELRWLAGASDRDVGAEMRQPVLWLSTSHLERRPDQARRDGVNAAEEWTLGSLWDRAKL